MNSSFITHLLLASALGMPVLSDAEAQAPALPPAQAQGLPSAITPRPPELEQLRQRMSRRAFEQSRELTDLYIKALATAERDAAAQGDYEQALAAQRRRLELADLSACTFAGPVPANSINLKPADARLIAGVTYNRTTDLLIGWTMANCTATWDIPSTITPGIYNLSVLYSSAPESGKTITGYLEVDAASSGLVPLSPNPPTPLMTSSDWGTFQPCRLPQIRVTRSATVRLVLRMTQPSDTTDTLHVRGVRLIPVSQAVTTPLANGSAPAGNELEKLQQRQSRDFQDAIKPLVRSYRKTLSDLFGNTKEDAEGGKWAELRSELRKVDQWLDKPANAASPVKSKLNPIAASEEWTDARFVEVPTNTGDHFVLSRGGKQFPVRLIGVACPPVHLTTTPDFRRLCRYFSITPESALLIGQQARLLTTSLLNQQELRVSASGVTDRAGAAFVSVQIPILGDLAAVLVDNGLAGVNPAKPLSPEDVPMEESYQLALQLREEAARLAAKPPGAWALRSDRPPNPEDFAPGPPPQS